MFLGLKSLKVAKKKNINSKPQVTPHISEKFKIWVFFLKQRYKRGSKKSSIIQKFWLSLKRVFDINFKNTVRVSPMKYSPKNIMGYFKASNLYTTNTSKTDSKYAAIKPKKVNLSAFLSGRFITPLPKI